MRFQILQHKHIITYSTLVCAIVITLYGCGEVGQHSETDPAMTTQTITHNGFLSEQRIVSWLRKTPEEIGCILDKGIAYRDTMYHCSSAPHSDSPEYYLITLEGDTASRIHPLIRQVRFDFEGGSLRELSFVFKDALDKGEIRHVFGLPDKGSQLPDNVMAIYFGENIIAPSDKGSGIETAPADTNNTKFLTIVGFEHTGAGD